jgi:hypothetical protein
MTASQSSIRSRYGDLRPLIDALAQTEVVGHALSSDLRILRRGLFGALPQGGVRYAGRGGVLRLRADDLAARSRARPHAGVTLRKSQTVSDWSTRPLTAKQIEYLVDDVRYLFHARRCGSTRSLPSAGVRRGRARRCARSSIAELSARSRGSICAYRGNARMNRRELGILNELANAARAYRARTEHAAQVRLSRRRDGRARRAAPAHGRRTQSTAASRCGMKKHYAGAIIEAIVRGEAHARRRTAAARPTAAGAAARGARRDDGRARQRRRGGKRFADDAPALAQRLSSGSRARRPRQLPKSTPH